MVANDNRVFEAFEIVSFGNMDKAFEDSEGRVFTDGMTIRMRCARAECRLMMRVLSNHRVVFNVAAEFGGRLVCDPNAWFVNASNALQHALTQLNVPGAENVEGDRYLGYVRNDAQRAIRAHLQDHCEKQNALCLQAAQGMVKLAQRPVLFCG